MARGPYSVMYPVDYRPNGDTTTEAFWKHMQEIDRIYGILTDLDANSMGSDDMTAAINNALTTHINSTNPHPNWKPKVSVDDVTGNFPMSRITGNLDSNRINGIENLVRTISKEAIGDTLGGSTYMTVGGILLQWGKYKLPLVDVAAPVTVTVKLPKPYQTFNFNHYLNGQLQSTTVHALYVTEVYMVANNYDGCKMTLDMHEDYTVEQGKKADSFVVTASLSGKTTWENGDFLWNTWGIAL